MSDAGPSGESVSRSGADGDGGDGGLGPAVVQVIGSGHLVDGTGFLVRGDADADAGTVLTCAHVVSSAGAGIGSDLTLCFTALAGMPSQQATVVALRPAEDVAVLRLAEVPEGAVCLDLAVTATGSRGARIRSFGFPVQAPETGHLGSGVVEGIIPAQAHSGQLLQLMGANSITTGFSGAPVVSEATGLVVGMVTSIPGRDDNRRGIDIAYAATPETLRAVWPRLTAPREINPYRGLEPFTADDAEWFAGRDAAVSDLLEKFSRHQRALLLLGPSGAGKSSLAQAGLLPALAAQGVPGSDRWVRVVARPGDNLLAAVEQAGLPGATTHGIATAVGHLLAAEPQHTRVVLVVDQFEELLVDLDAERRPEVDSLIEAITSDASLSVVLVMRDDFYPVLAAGAPELLALPDLGHHSVPSSISRGELLAMIEGPARKAAVRFESKLPDLIVNDVINSTPRDGVHGRAANTVLPLLQVTLSQLWDARDVDGRLTADAYRRVNGFTGSLTLWCDSAMAQVPAKQHPTAWRLLTALVRPSDNALGVGASRKQVPRAELVQRAADDDIQEEDVNEAIDVLIDRRVIVTTSALKTVVTTSTPDESAAPTSESGPLVELIHEALIHNWEGLQRAIERERDYNQFVDQATQRHKQWLAHRRRADLLSGTLLATGQALQERRRRLPDGVNTYLKASKRHARTTLQRSRALNAILALLVIAALSLTLYARNKQQAAEHQQSIQLSQQVAAQSALLMDTDPDLASLLAVKAYDINPSSRAQANLETAASIPLRNTLPGPGGAVRSMAFSPDGSLLAMGTGEGKTEVRDATTGRLAYTIPAPSNAGAVNSVAFGGRHEPIVAIGYSTGIVLIWDAADRKPVQLELPTNETNESIHSVAVSSDGTYLAIGGNKFLLLYHFSNGNWSEIHPPGEPGAYKLHSPVSSLQFRPGTHSLAVAYADRAVDFVDEKADHYYIRKPQEDSQPDISVAMAFAKDDTLAATGLDPDDANKVEIFDDSSDSSSVSLKAPFDSPPVSVSYSEDSALIAVGYQNGTTILWDVNRKKILSRLKGHAGAVEAVSFDSHDHLMATAGQDGDVRMWTLPESSAFLALPTSTSTADEENVDDEGSEAVNPVRLSADGSVLAGMSADDDIFFWNATTGKYRGKVHDPCGSDDNVDTMSFGATGTLLAVNCGSGHRYRVDASPGHDVSSAQRLSDAHSVDGELTKIASRDGSLTAEYGEGDAITLTNRRERGKVFTLTAPDAGSVSDIAFTSDDTVMAVLYAAADGSRGLVRLWDTSTHRVLSSLPAGPTDFPDAISIAPDSSTIAVRYSTPVKDSPPESTAIGIWDIRFDELITTLDAPEDATGDLNFGPQAHELAVGGQQGVYLWTSVVPEPAQAKRKICASVVPTRRSADLSAYVPGAASGHLCVSHGEENTSPPSTQKSYPPCTAAQLSTHPQEGSPGAGNYDEDIVFTNTSNTPCTLTGYATISLQDKKGRNIQKSDNTPGIARTLTLYANDRAALHWMYSDGRPDEAFRAACDEGHKNVDHARISLPGQRTSINLSGGPDCVYSSSTEPLRPYPAV